MSDMVPDDERVDEAFRASPLFRELEGIIDSGDFSRFDSQARRQHVVPRFLLDNFAAVDAGRSWIYQLDATRRGAPLPVQTKAAAAHRHFYSLLDDEGNRNNRIEGFLARVENHAAQAIDRFLADPLALEEGDRATLSFFIALQDHRTPAGVRRMTGMSDTLMRMLLLTSFSDRSSFAETYRQAIGEGEDQEIEAMRQTLIAGLHDGSIAFADPRIHALQSGLDIAVDQSLVIYSMDWTLLRSEQLLATSERGLAIHDPTPIYPWGSQALLSSPHSETTIPLNSQACLRLTPGGYGLDSAEVDAHDVDLLNLRIYGWAEGYMYGETQELLARLRRLARQRPADVIRPRRRFTVMLIERDPHDDSLAEEYRRRGWPPYLTDGPGVLHDYLLIPEGESAAAAIERVQSTVRERARRALGIPEGEELPGRHVVDHIGLPGLVVPDTET